jgi:hypothetical protein
VLYPEYGVAGYGPCWLSEGARLSPDHERAEWLGRNTLTGEGGGRLRSLKGGLQGQPTVNASTVRLRDFFFSANNIM